jgi:shikimate dehydrogenase
MSAAPPTPALCGIILHPAGHTLSPLIHAAAYAELGLDARYHAFDVPLERVRDAVAGMRGLGLRQLSVSLPLKEAVLALADRASDAARAIGAANTLTRVGEALVADNTDWIGVVRSLEPLGSWRGARALVLGAGGAARATVYALRQLGAQVRVHARTRARAEKLAGDLGAELAPADSPWDLLINATPVGMHPETGSTPFELGRLNSAGTVLDLVYRPLETRLLREARARGCRTLDGLDMLVHQAVEQIRLWSGRSASAAPLRAAALAELRRS